MREVSKDPERVSDKIEEMEKRIKYLDRYDTEISRELESARRELTRRDAEMKQSEICLSKRLKNQTHQLRLSKDSLESLTRRRAKRKNKFDFNKITTSRSKSKMIREWQYRQKRLAMSLVKAQRHERTCASDLEKTKRELRSVDVAAAELANIQIELHAGLRQILNSTLNDEVATLARELEDAKHRKIVKPFDRDGFLRDIREDIQSEFENEMDALAQQIVDVRNEGTGLWETLVSDFSNELERKYRERLENMDTETRELQYSRVEMEEQVSSVAEKFEDRVKELTRLAAPRVKKQLLLRLKFKVREMWSALNVPADQQISILRNVVYFDELTKKGADSARSYITKELDTLYILKSMRKYHLAVQYMESLSSMLKTTVQAGSIKSPLHKRLQRQATRQKWSAVRAKVLTLAKHVEVLVKKWETRWNLTYTVMNQNGERVPFRDSDWRAKEYEIKSIPIEIDRTYMVHEAKTGNHSREMELLHELMRKTQDHDAGRKNEEEDLFEQNRSMNSDVIRDSEQVVEDLDSSMSEIKNLFEEIGSF